MSSPIQQSNPQPIQTAAVVPSSANPTTAGAVASSNAPGGVTSATVISSLEELKKQAPEVYNKMLQGIATNICSEMKAHQERLKQLMRKGQER